jgi:putative hemolysin
LDSWKWFLFLALFCILTQSFFAMMEMACVSFNKVRLQYYLSRNLKSVLWLNYLLKRPALLFGATLISINAALLIGSECARRFYESIGASPLFAPLTQAFLVLVFAEIAPMFAGRRYAEHAVMIGAGPLYFLAQILRPFIWMIDLLCRWIHRIFGSTLTTDLYLSREELQSVIEDREEKVQSEEKGGLNTVVASIFSLKNKTAKELMIPVKKVSMLSVRSHVSDMRELLKAEYVPYIPIFHKDKKHIIAIAYPRDLLRIGENKKIRDHAKSPWFVTESASIMQILKQFRKNNQSVAVVLNRTGSAVGVLTLDEIVDTIFAKDEHFISFADAAPGFTPVAVDRAFPGDMSLCEFRDQYHVDLRFKEAETLAESMEMALGHVPRAGESVKIDQFELTVEETNLLGPKTILVRTLT